VTSALATVLGIVAPVFLVAAVGFAWVRAGLPYDRAGITLLIANVGAPCLVFRNLAGLGVDPQAMLSMAGAALLTLAAFLVVGYAVVRALRLPAHTFLAPLVFMNAGNMGLAICDLAFPGDAGGQSPGLALGVCYFAVASSLQFTLGIALWSGRFSVVELARTPLTWAVALAAGVVWLGVSLPTWLLETTELLGSLAIPLMLLSLGASLSGLEIARLGRSLLLSGVRLGLGAGVGFAVAALLGFEGTERGVLILECAMPVAVFNALLAERYERSPHEVAGLVVISTLLSFLTLPFVLAAVV